MWAQITTPSYLGVNKCKNLISWCCKNVYIFTYVVIFCLCSNIMLILVWFWLYICYAVDFILFSTHPNRVTRPLEEAVMVPSSSTVYSAEMLSCRKSPSGSFFCWAYHFPAYWQNMTPYYSHDHQYQHYTAVF